MKIIISVQALFDEGDPAWAYHHEELIVAPPAGIPPEVLMEAARNKEPLPAKELKKLEDVNRETAGETIAAILHQLKLAEESIVQQSARDIMDDPNGPPPPRT